MTDCVVTVWSGGRCRVAQRGNYGGYPSVTLLDIAGFCTGHLATAVLRTKFVERVRRCVFDDELLCRVQRPRSRVWKRTHPQLMADGSDVLHHLLRSDRPRAILLEDCRWRLSISDYVYAIDLDRLTLEAYRGRCMTPPRSWERFFPREEGVLPEATEARLLLEGPRTYHDASSDWFPPRLVAAYHVEDPPDRDECNALESEIVEAWNREYEESAAGQYR